MPTNDQILRSLILRWGVVLEERMKFASGVRVLAAIAEVESSFGHFSLPRHEKSFDVGGPYFKKDLWTAWGSWAACSYSSFQIMFPVAVELGYRGSPTTLWDDEVAIHWVIEYIRKRILDRGCDNLHDFADAYNSGSFRDAFVPQSYIAKFLSSYADVLERRGLKQGGSSE